MDGLTRFTNSNLEVTETIETVGKSVTDRLSDIERELLIQRKGQEGLLYGDELEDNDNVDLSEVPAKEVDND